jgi:cephalosporin-C deacetylase-like acetyl esterase
MRRHEITYPSVNNELFPKFITASVMEPDTITPRTGVMLFSHGWGSNRYHHEDKMAWTCDRFDLVCLCVEYRQSGLAFDPSRGIGAEVPYDASFLQVFDVLNAVRAALNLRPALHRGRIFHYGTSQGGHIALLGAVFAPNTFAFVYPSSPLFFLDEERQKWTGRYMAGHEMSARNALEHADQIRCPVFLEYGTADSTLPPQTQFEPLARKLRDLGTATAVVPYEGGNHGLEPTITRFDAFKKMAAEPMRTLTNPRRDDFLAGTRIEIACADRTLCIDWSKPPDNAELVCWK